MDTRELATPTGIEPAIFAVTGRRVNRYTTGPLHSLEQPKGCVWETIDCITCYGAGEVTEEFMQRREEGARIRNERLARGESMKEAANRLGMTLIEYNKYEHGRLVR